jgi:hypothetical protein
MKFPGIIFTAIIFCITAITAQESQTTSRDAKRKVVPGIKFGINRSNVYNTSGDAFSADRKQGFAAGIFVALPVGGLLGIQPEMIFQQKGFEGTGHLVGDKYIISRTTTHLDIPVQLQVKLFKWFTFLAGPQYSFLLKQNDRFTYEGNSAARSTDFEDDQIREGTFGTLVGVDLNIGHLVLSYRSGWDVSDNRPDGFSATPSYRNRWMQWTVGYRFY